MRTASIDAFVARKKSTPVLKLASRKFPFCGGAGVASRDQTCPNEKLLPPRWSEAKAEGALWQERDKGLACARAPAP